MREIRTSGLMSGDGKRDGASIATPALALDSTGPTLPGKREMANLQTAGFPAS